MKKQEIDAVFDEHKEIYIFFAILRPNSITYLQQLGYKTYLKLLRLTLSATNLVDLLIRSSDKIGPNNDYLQLIKF